MGLANGLNSDAIRDLNNFADNVWPIVSEDLMDAEDFTNEDLFSSDEPDYESEHEYESMIHLTRNMQRSLELKLDKIIAQNELILRQNREILKLARARQLPLPDNNDDKDVAGDAAETSTNS